MYTLNEYVSIKRYDPQYEAQVIELIVSIQQQEYNVPITLKDQPDLLAIQNTYQRGNGNFWVALYDGCVVGTISLLDIGNEQVALRKMFVKQAFRGATYKTAHLLLETALAWAKERDVADIFLGTTPQFLAAHKFYEKNAFISIHPQQLPENFPILQVDKKFYHYPLKKAHE